jgi:hypothetical protein
MHRRVDNIKTHVKETGWERRFIRLGYGHAASSCAHGNEPLGFHEVQGVSQLPDKLVASHD